MVKIDILPGTDKYKPNSRLKFGIPDIRMSEHTATNSVQASYEYILLFSVVLIKLHLLCTIKFQLITSAEFLTLNGIYVRNFKWYCQSKLTRIHANFYMHQSLIIYRKGKTRPQTERGMRGAFRPQ